MRSSVSRWFVPLLVLTLLGAVPVAARSTPAGSGGIGDPYFPSMGNGGYDVQHYAIDLAVDPKTGYLVATTVIEARATQDLAAFSFDFAGPPLVICTVDGTPAECDRARKELTVTPDVEIANGATFTVRFLYTGIPRAGAGQFGGGWTISDEEVYVFGEPTGAETWFPVNGHPLDKATYSLRVTVPKPFDVAAGGLLTGPSDNGATRTFLWEMGDPAASYLVALHIAKLDETTATGPRGLPIRNYFDERIPDGDRAAFDLLPEMIASFETSFGPYPFEAYGATVVDDEFGAALETQTMATHSRDATAESVVAHELAHQWFGDSVGLKRWQDIWLNEGFASYAEWLWVEDRRGDAALQEMFQTWYSVLSARTALSDTAMREVMNGRSLVETMLAAYPGFMSREEILATFGASRMNQLEGITAAEAIARLEIPPTAFEPVALGDPGPDNLFRGTVYLRGAVTLHALRLRLGDDAFFQTLRAYTERYRHANADTDDFIAVAEAVSGDELDPFFDAWLYQPALPPIPEAKLTPQTR